MKVLKLSAAVCFLGLAGCGGYSVKAPGEIGAGEETLPSVQTTEATREAIVRKIEVPGSVEGYETSDLYAKVGGYLASMEADIGDRVTGPVYDPATGRVVKPGQVLARLSIPEMDKQLAQKQALVEQALAQEKQAQRAAEAAKAEEDSARAAHDEAVAMKAKQEAEKKFRQATLDLVSKLGTAGYRERQIEAEHGLAMAEAGLKAADARIATAKALVAAAEKNTAKAKADADSAAAHVRVARADKEYFEELAKYAVIRAPFDGVITRRLLDPGAFVQPAEGNSAAQPLLTVARTDRLRIVVPLPMAEVRWLNKSDPVSVRVESLPTDKPFKGHIARYSPGLHKNTRTMRVEVELDEHDDRVLPGTYVYVTVDLVHYPQSEGEPAPVVLPAWALRTDEKGKFVYVVEDGAVRREGVETLYEDGKKVGLREGLQGGETVVTGSSSLLTDGQKVATK